ncbi:hypothetical protein [Streptomyces sp. NPDC054783]
MGKHAGDASAVPQNLYEYAKNSVSGIQDLQAFTRSLSGYIASYQASAIDYGRGIFSVGEGAGSEHLDTAVLKAVSAIVALDHWVSSVGREFEEAGRGSGLTPPADVQPGTPGVVRSDPFGLGWRTSAIRTNDAALDFAARRDGAHLAQVLREGLDSPNGPDLRLFFEQLRATGLNDPAFNAGFFNSLTPTDMSNLLAYRHWQSADLNGRNAFPTGLQDLFQAFVNAEAGGGLDPAHERLFLQSVFSHDRGGDLVTPLLNALGDSPAGAVAFARTHPPQQLTSLFKGGSTEQQAAYLAFLRADLLGDPRQADSLLALAKSLLITYPKGEANRADRALLTVTSGGFEGMSPQMAAFLRAYLSVKIGKPSHDLDKWDERITGTLGNLAPFYSAMVNTGNKEHLDYAKSSEWAKAFMTTVLVAGGVETGLPEVELFGGELFGSARLAGMASKAVIGGAAGGGVFAVEPRFTKLIFGEEAEEGEEPSNVFRRAMEHYARMMAVARLSTGGYVRDGRNGPRVTWGKLSDHRGMEALGGKIDDLPERYWVVFPDGEQVTLRYFVRKIRVPEAE